MCTERTFTISPDDLDWKDVWAAMGYNASVPGQDILDLAQDVAARLLPYARLKIMFRRVMAEKVSSRQITLDGKMFTPNGIICSYLDGMTEACVFVATAGLEFHEKVREMKKEGDVLADFIADSIGTVLAEQAVGKVEAEFGSGDHQSLSYSPGYCNWNISEQEAFFSLFPPHPCGITLSPSFLMTPEKSVSGFFAFGEDLVRQPYRCEICKNPSCYKRKEGQQSR